MQLSFSFLAGRYGIYRCESDADFPLTAERFLSFTRTEDEVSIVCGEGTLPLCDKQEVGFSVMKLQGPFPLDTVGVLAEVSRILADAKIALFVISTFDTDYILIKETKKKAALAALKKAGHRHLST